MGIKKIKRAVKTVGGTIAGGAIGAGMTIAKVAIAPIALPINTIQGAREGYRITKYRPTRENNNGTENKENEG